MGLGGVLGLCGSGGVVGFFEKRQHLAIGEFPPKIEISCGKNSKKSNSSESSLP